MDETETILANIIAAKARLHVDDQDIREAVETIVQHSLKFTLDNHTYHHVHLRVFRELTAEQRKAAAGLMLWLAHDVLLLNQIEEPNPTAWQDLIREELEQGALT